MSDDERTILDYRPSNRRPWTRAERVIAGMALTLCYGIPMVCPLWSWLGICWTNWRFFGVWQLGPIFAPATGTNRYERWFLAFPMAASAISPIVGLAIYGWPVLRVFRRPAVMVACVASIALSSCLITGFIAVVLGEEASP